MLELIVPGTSMTIHPTVIQEAGGCVLIDTGMPGCRGPIESLMALAEIDPDNLQGIILTHQDTDHIGGLPQWLAGIETGTLAVYAHEADRPVIDGEKLGIKMSPERLAGLKQAMPEPVRQSFEAVFSGASRNVNRLVEDGETLPIGGGLTAIHTPGHTPGHISLYHQPSKTLIAGDAMIVASGELSGPNPSFTPDMPLALRSLRKLAAFDIERVICYHGGLYTGEDVNGRIAEIAAQGMSMRSE